MGQKLMEGGDIIKNSKRELLLAALLTSPTIRQAAASVNVPERTVYAWLSEPDFKADYEKQKRQAVTEAADYLKSRMNAAAQVVDSIMTDVTTPPNVRLNAASMIIKTGLRLVETGELIERLELLEAAIADNRR